MRTILMIVLVMLLVQSAAGAFPAEESSYSIYINGSRIEFRPLMKDDMLYLPVQIIASKLEQSFEWNPSLNTVRINDQLINSQPCMSRGIIYMPAESIARALNASIRMDGRSRRVEIVTSGGAPAQNVQSSADTVSPAPAPASAGMESPGTVKVMPLPGTETARPGQDSNTVQQPAVLPEQNGQAPQQAASPAPKSQKFKLKKTAEEIGAAKIERVMARLNNVPGMAGTMPYPQVPGINDRPKGPSSAEPVDLNSQQQIEASRSTYPSPSAYPGTSNSGDARGSDEIIFPLNGPPSMPSNLQLPPTGVEYSGTKSPGGVEELSSTPMFPSNSSYVARKAQNKVFSVTVSNIEEVNTIKSYYKPNAGSKYVIIYISQQNISNLTQIYSGKFSLVDENNKVYEYREALSNFWLVILKPGGMNFGYLVYEVPQGSTPTRLVLHALNQEPFFVKLD